MNNIIIATIAIIFVVFVFFIQNKITEFIKVKILFHPLIENSQYDGKYNKKDVYVNNNGKKIHAWLISGNLNGTIKNKTIVISHGNGGNISHRSILTEMLNDLGCDVCIYDYQGYGQSQGSPSESNCYSDGEAIMNYLIGSLSILPKDIILLGESLGSGVSSYLATKYDVDGVIILSGFTSIKDMVHSVIPFLKCFKCFFNEFPTHKYLQQCKKRCLILHSHADGLIPYDHAIRNSQCCNSQLVEIKGPHNAPEFPNDIIDKIRLFIMDEVIIKKYFTF